MMFKPVVLWTDALVYLLIAALVAFGFYVSRREQLRERWGHVIRNRLAVASLVVLVAYVAVGLLDSVHFRPALPHTPGEQQTHYSSQILSLLDVVLAPLRTAEERTYSAPFAAYSYVKETVSGPGGKDIRKYPRLEYGGRQLSDPATQRIPDILRRTAWGVGEGLVLAVLLGAGVCAWRGWRGGTGFRQAAGEVLGGRTEVPWRVALLTAAAVLVLITVSVNLAPWYHIFGTDKVGEDVYYQTLKSIRTGLVIGTLTTLVMLPFAIMLGIMAGYFRGWVDDVIQYVYTTLNSIPGVLLIAAAVLMLQVYIANHPDLFDTNAQRADLRLLGLCMILGVTNWTGLCRLLRGEALKLAESDYVQAARAFGVGDFPIMVRHIVPNVMHIVLISVVLDFSGLVLAEAVLSYVGVGVDPTMNSWGNMINRARLEMARDPMVWWSLLAAFVFMVGLVLAANLFSDAVRDAFDPHLHER
ncbi:MAG TPA: ABC transporter permease [Gammaproteobacteria bacterium]|nr:ABC transporter permease [Gammaproteobacteria bacterium]